MIDTLDQLFGRLTIWVLALATSVGILVKIVRSALRIWKARGHRRG